MVRTILGAAFFAAFWFVFVAYGLGDNINRRSEKIAKKLTGYSEKPKREFQSAEERRASVSIDGVGYVDNPKDPDELRFERAEIVVNRMLCLVIYAALFVLMLLADLGY